jgi:hypothetical protein
VRRDQRHTGFFSIREFLANREPEIGGQTERFRARERPVWSPVSSDSASYGNEGYVASVHDAPIQRPRLTVPVEPR